LQDTAYFHYLTTVELHALPVLLLFTLVTLSQHSTQAQIQETDEKHGRPSTQQTPRTNDNKSGKTTESVHCTI